MRLYLRRPPEPVVPIGTHLPCSAPPISSGEMFRRHRRRPELGRLAEQHIAVLVPDEPPRRWSPAGSSSRIAAALLLDGFPRCATAAWIGPGRVGRRNRAVLRWKWPTRLSSESPPPAGSRTGAIYHLKYAAPPTWRRGWCRQHDTEATAGALRRYHADTASMLPMKAGPVAPHRRRRRPAEVTDRIVQSLQTNARLGGKEAV